MNKTEAEYDLELREQLHNGTILWYRFEGIKLKLADLTTYTPDFLVMNSQGLMECQEVKGFWQDDAKVKIKVAAEQFPFIFLAVHKRSKKEGGGWRFEEF